MPKANFEDIKGVIGRRKSKDRRYNDQIQQISSKYSTTTENNINCIPMANDTYPCYNWNKCLWTVWNEMFDNSVLSTKHLYVLTRTVVYRKQNIVHVLNWPICSAYLLPNGVDRRAYKLKDHNNMVGLDKTERAIKNRQTTNTVNIGHKTLKEETKKQTAKKTKMSNTNTTNTC
jgi:hypothetical protein